MKDKAKIKELKGIAVDFAYHIHLTKQGDVSHNKHIEIFDEWAESKGIYNRPSFDPTVTDEEIERIVGEAIGEASMCWSKTPKGVFDSSRANEIVDRILNLFQSRLSQPGECDHNLESLGTRAVKCIHCDRVFEANQSTLSQPVTGYSEEDIREAIRIHIPDSATVEFRGLKYVGSKIDAIIQSLKSKPNNGSQELTLIEKP